VVAFLEALVAGLRIRIMNDLSLLIVGRHLMQLLESRGITGNVAFPITNGVDQEAIRGVLASDLHSDAVFIGRIAYSKGITDLVRVWIEQREQRKQYSLTLAGPIEAGLREKIKTITQDENKLVRVIGPLTDRQVISVLKSSRVLVLPSPYESFSLVSVEALACGIPVATYDSPGTKEFLLTPAVVTVPLRDATELVRRAMEILEDDKKRVMLGKIGMEFVSRYNWSRIAADEARHYRIIVQLAKGQHEIERRDELESEHFPTKPRMGG
jgi:glycosyltransferase involved in cell wall biosynthesis